MRDKNEGAYRRGGKKAVATCLSHRRLLRVKPHMSFKLEYKKQVMIAKKKRLMM